MEDYYSILGVSRDASQKDIQKAFRALAHKYHPDKQGGDEQRFKKINEAYQVLGNEKRRAQYDAGGFSTGGQGFSGFEEVFTQGGFSANIQDIFQDIFRGFRDRGTDIQVDVTISFEESVFGVTRQLTIPYRRKKQEQVALEIPPGVETGMRVHLAGKGEPARSAQFPDGDLYVRLTVAPHAQYRKQGGDLLYTVSLTPSEAILGVTKQIPSLQGGTIAVSVPKRSSAGTKVTVSGHGIAPPYGTGNMIVVCTIGYPNTLSTKAAKLFEELQKEGW